MLRAILVVFASASLVGCSGHTRVIENASLEPGEYRLQWEYGAVDSIPLIGEAMALKASELCPDGWLKVRENRIPRGGIMAPLIVWDIRCNAPEVRK